MIPETSQMTTKLCPTCGTRLSEGATRCLVCGANLSVDQKPGRAAQAVQGSRMPEITLSLPLAISLLALFLAIGAILVFTALRSTPEATIPSTVTATATITVTPSLTPTQAPPTLTNTPEPSPTPITYLVKQNDNCIGIAAFFNVSLQSIVTLNNLPAACDNLYINQPLLIPHPTATPTPFPTATLSEAEQTEAACEKVDYFVKETDTLSSISLSFNVPMAAIRDYNGLTGDTVFLGQNLVIPLCRRFAAPGPSPTPTPPPPYAAPNLLLPADGAPFNLSHDIITLQWASVGTLRDNEYYEVTIVDITEGEERRLVDYVTDTKYIIPNTLRPRESTPHVFRWWVGVVRQSGTDASGKPVYLEAGFLSTARVFTWSGAFVGITPTP